MNPNSKDELAAKFALDVQRAQALEDRAAQELANAKAKLKAATDALPESANVKRAKQAYEDAAEYRAGLIRDGVAELPFADGD